MVDFGRSFFSFLGSFFVYFDVKGDQDIHWVGSSVLILRRMVAILLGFSLY